MPPPRGALTGADLRQAPLKHGDHRLPARVLLLVGKHRLDCRRVEYPQPGSQGGNREVVVAWQRRRLRCRLGLCRPWRWHGLGSLRGARGLSVRCGLGGPRCLRGRRGLGGVRVLGRRGGRGGRRGLGRARGLRGGSGLRGGCSLGGGDGLCGHRPLGRLRLAHGRMSRDGGLGSRGPVPWRCRGSLLCPVRRADLFGRPGADLVGGQQDLADPREDRSEHNHGSLFDAVIDLRYWHSGSPGMRACAPLAGVRRLRCESSLSLPVPFTAAGAGEFVRIRAQSTASPTAGDSGPVGLTYHEGMSVKTRRVLLAKPRGYCAGVDRAVQAVEVALELYGAPVYVRKQIVHNAHVVASLEARGAVFVEEAGEVPEGAVVVFSAHGVAPQVREEARARGLRTVDATCPLVTKVHNEARRFAAQGYDILLIGHAGHEEVAGTAGEAPAHIRLVEGPGGAAGARVRDPAKVAWLSQTTLSVDETQQTVAALRQRFPLLADPPSDDICYATQNRQAAVKAIAGRP